MIKKDRKYAKKILRLIYILNKLDTGKRVSTAELAEEFTVSLRTVQRDLALLNLAGFPLVSIEKGVHSFMEGFSLRKMKISGEEASLLSLLYEITQSLGNVFEDSFRNILRKAIAEKYDTPFYIKIPEGVKLEKGYPFLKDLEKAINEDRKVVVHYIAAGKKRGGDFKLCPLKIIFYDGFWYLLSQTEDKAVLPKFRLENIKKVEVLDEYFDPPENLMSVLDESVNIMFSEKRDKKAVLKVDKDAARYFKQRVYFPLQKIKKENKDGSLIIETRVSQYAEIMPIIFRWIPHIFVIKPKDMREKMKNNLQNYLEDY